MALLCCLFFFRNIGGSVLNGFTGDGFLDGLPNVDEDHNVGVDSSSDGYLSEVEFLIKF